MRSHYLLTNNVSAETITVKFEHCGEIWISIGITYYITLFISDVVEIYKVFAINSYNFHCLAHNKLKLHLQGGSDHSFIFESLGLCYTPVNSSRKLGSLPVFIKISWSPGFFSKLYTSSF